MDATVEELGLTKALPIPGGGALEYVMEEVWSDDHIESELSLYCVYGTVVQHHTTH